MSLTADDIAVPAISSDAEPPSEKTDAATGPLAVPGVFRGGSDTNGREYDSLASMWSSELKDGEGVTEWYQKSEAWWASEENCPATVDGVLGGYGCLDYDDVAESTAFIQKMRRDHPAFSALRGRALDCGAGIGRVTKHLLRHFFETTDLIEGNRRLLDEVPAFMQIGEPVEGQGRVGELICCRLQELRLRPSHYDCIWIQWVVIYLTDPDFIQFLVRCGAGLRSGGMIFLKENVLKLNSDVDFLVDKDDTSLTRSKGYMERIFEEAGMRIICCEQQKVFPHDMFPVWTWAMILK